MSLPLRAVALLAAVSLAACATPRPSAPVSAAGIAADASASASQLLGAVQHDADAIDLSKDPAERTQLVAAATASAQTCLSRYPDSGICLYAQAQADGLNAQARPLDAIALLKDMLARLTKAEAVDPGLDHAGPARLSAIVLLRAPPWPIGPGDADAALAAARRAVTREPGYPSNLITLGAAQAKSVGTDAARASFTKAQAAVQAWTGAPAQEGVAVAADKAKWQQQIAQGLHDLQ